jgi:outer membrane protein, heavy metal efflux system
VTRAGAAEPLAVSAAGARRRLGNGLVIVAALAAAGCVTYRPQPLHPAESAARFEARRLDDAGLRRFVEQAGGRPVAAWPPAAIGFDQLTLAALYFSPDLDVARAQLAASEAAEVTAGARANPALAFTPEWVSNPERGVRPWVLSLVLDVPLRTAGRRAIRIAEARHLSEAARLRLGDEAWRVRSTLRARLVELWHAEAGEELLRRQDATAQERLGLAEARLAAGEVAQPEVVLARRDRERVALALALARQQRAAALVRVAGAIGVSAQALADQKIDFGFTDELPAAAELGSQRVRSEALLNRPDVLAALAEYAAAESALQLEVARQYPNVDLGPGYTYDKGSRQWALGVALPLPLMNRNRGPIAEAEAHRREAEARFLALQAAAIGAADQAFAEYRTAVGAVADARGLLASGDATLAAARRRLAAGETDRLRVLDAEVDRDTDALAVLEARAAAQAALGRVEDAMRRPLAPAAPLPALSEAGPRPAGEERP